MTTVVAGWGPFPRPTSATSAREAGTVRAPDFPAGLDWINVARPLHIADLRGRLAIIDFWTFC